MNKNERSVLDKIRSGALIHLRHNDRLKKDKPEALLVFPRSHLDDMAIDHAIVESLVNKKLIKVLLDGTTVVFGDAHGQTSRRIN